MGVQCNMVSEFQEKIIGKAEGVQYNMVSDIVERKAEGVQCDIWVKNPILDHPKFSVGLQCDLISEK